MGDTWQRARSDSRDANAMEKGIRTTRRERERVSGVILAGPTRPPLPLCWIGWIIPECLLLVATQRCRFPLFLYSHSSTCVFGYAFIGPWTHVRLVKCYLLSMRRCLGFTAKVVLLSQIDLSFFLLKEIFIHLIDKIY